MPEPRDEIKELKDYTPGKTEPGLVKLASNENPFGPSPFALKAIANEAKNLHIYPDQKSNLLCKALAEKAGLFEQSVIIGNGSDDLMQIAASTFLQPGEEVIMPAKSFSVYNHVTKIFGGKAVFAEDLDSMAKAINSQTKMVFICSPNNPTGQYINKTDLDNFLNKVPENILVVIDEAYVDYVEAQDFPNSLDYIKAGKSILVLRTFSKFYGLAGLRVGYGFAGPELVKYMMRAKMPFNVSRVAQAGALAALEDKSFAEQTYKNNLEGKQYLYAELDKLGLNYKKTQANFIFIELNKAADEVFIEMMRSGVIIRPLTSFGFPKAIRVSIGTKEENQKFITALAQVLA